MLILFKLIKPFLEIFLKKGIYTLFGCGGDRDKSKRAETGGIVEKYSSNIIITEDNSRTEKFQKDLKMIFAEGIKDTK